MAQNKTPLLTPLMRWFLLAMILANIAGSMTNLLMPVYLTELGASVGQVGLVFTLTSVVILVLQILGGWISDSIGRLRAIAIGSLGFISLPAPWLGAQLWERFNPRLPFLITALVALATILPTWLKFKLPGSSKAEVAPAIT
jgi:MFS family permease